MDFLRREALRDAERKRESPLFVNVRQQRKSKDVKQSRLVKKYILELSRFFVIILKEAQ